MSQSANPATEARRQAQALLSKRKEADLVNERDRARSAEAQKTARLRELRLAKEAAEKAGKKAAKRRFETARRADFVKKDEVGA